MFVESNFFSSGVSSFLIGLSTSSTYAIGALSPFLKPHLRILKYPPALLLYLGPNSLNNFPTISLSLKRLKANLLLWTLVSLARVIIGSAYFLNSLAFGRVVLISSCLNNETTIFLNIAFLWLLVLFNFLCALPCRMLLLQNCF